MTNQNLAAEINAMAEADQAMRAQAERSDRWDKGLDKKHVSQLECIISNHGWPTIPLVGKKASFNAWLIAQHADHNLAFQKRALTLIKESHQRDARSVSPSCIAFLTDRILVAEGRKQIFGTQFYRNKSGDFVPRPILDIVNIEARRSAYGLASFAEDLEGAAERNDSKG